MSWTNYLRLGIIFTVTGIIVLAHYGLTSTGHLSHGLDLIIGIVLVVLGLPLAGLGIRLRRKTRAGGPPGKRPGSTNSR